jgi:membrane-bound lytic murein transglycosylase MltF
VREFERWVDKAYVKRPLTVNIVATTRNELFCDLNKGLADIAVGNRSVTDERKRIVDRARFEERQRRDPGHRAVGAGGGVGGRSCRPDGSKMCQEAAKRGLDPDKWFNDVEVVTAERIGMETTTYVRNIHKYHVSYSLSEDAPRSRR